MFIVGAARPVLQVSALLYLSNMADTCGFLSFLAWFLSMFQRGFQEAIFLHVHNIPCALISVSTLLTNQYWVNPSSWSKIAYYPFIPFLMRSSPFPKLPSCSGNVSLWCYLLALFQLVSVKSQFYIPLYGRSLEYSDLEQSGGTWIAAWVQEWGWQWGRSSLPRRASWCRAA